MKTVSLNSEQQKAADHKDGPLLVVAGAGAGKTKTITERVVNLIRGGVEPNTILAITFTNKAAKEMLERIEKRLTEEGMLSFDVFSNNRPTIKTFHSFGLQIIREQSALLGLTKHATVLDDDDALATIKEAIVSLGLDPKQYEPRKFRSFISKQKGDNKTPSGFREEATGYLGKVLADVWERYEASLQKEHALDFDDLLIKPVFLFEKYPELLLEYQRRFLYIHVDEYQDTNEAQYKMVSLLAGKHRNICVVGDADQTIYSWRGANLKNLLRFEEDYPEATVVLLEENYRSTKTILAAANEVIKKNTLRKEKNLFTQKEDGEPITLFQAWDEGREATTVARKAEELIKNGCEPKEIAVLYRANFQSRVLEQAMLTRQVPYQVLGVRFFERREVKDMLSYLKAALNRNALIDLKRAISSPPKGIGKTTILKILSGKQDELPLSMRDKVNQFFRVLDAIEESLKKNRFSETVALILEKSGMSAHLLKSGTEEDLERLENIRELVSLATTYDILEGEDAATKFLEEAALVSDQDTEKKNMNAVRLMTVHASKGLEFRYVFITGMEQDLFPHKRLESEHTQKDQSEEERRLFYVALTRAKEKVFLSYTELRTIFGAKQIQAPSEFLGDIPEGIVSVEIGAQENDIKTILYD